MESGIGIIKNFMRQNSFPSIFRGGRKCGDQATDASLGCIPQLSPIANSVVARCSKILLIPTEELQQNFEMELPDYFRKPSSYARNFLEFCSYEALQMVTQQPDYLSDKEFRRLTYDMMLAWEAPGTESQPLLDDLSCNDDQEFEDEDTSSLFYSNSISMAVQVDRKKTVGREAFVRIAPACTIVADIITVHNLFDALTSTSCGQLHYLMYDKYLGSLDKVIRNAKSAYNLPMGSNLHLAEEEIILDFDGTVPTQPVLQHMGISAWPGRLTLTSHALYFESFGVGSYDKAVRYDLATDMKQVIRPELTGPLGARLFDKAVMYKSTSVAEPVYLEFPELKGNSRRDYWLEIVLEILHTHKFIRKYNLKHIQQMEVLAKAILGVFRHRAVREAFHAFPSHYKTLLTFNLAEKLPGGDMILETLFSRLELLTARTSKPDVIGAASDDTSQQASLSPFSLVTLNRVGFRLRKQAEVDGEIEFLFGDVCVGETNPLEIAVKQSKCDIGRVEAAQATVNQVKVEGIDTNIVVMKDLLFPVVESCRRLQFLTSWEDPFKSTVFLLLIVYAICRDWVKYVLPCIFLFLAVLMLWRKHCNKGKPLEAFKVTPPPRKNAVEQLLTLQEAISQLETVVKAVNIVLLKLRALLFAVIPQATEKVALLLILMGLAFAFVPLKILMVLIFLEAYTREMPMRKNCSDRWVRRIREWWFTIPAAPVHLTNLKTTKRENDQL